MPKLTIICDDCLNVLPTIPSESVDMILTDPPFMISREMKIRRSRNPQKFTKYRGKDLNFFYGKWDIFESEKVYWKFTFQWLDLAWKTLRKGGHCCIFFDKMKITPLAKWVEKHDGIMRQPLFWIKTNPVPCLLENTYLLTAEGLKKIKDTHNEIDNLINVAGKVVRGIKSEQVYRGNIYKIYTWNIEPPLLVTPNHLIYALKIQNCPLKGKKIKCAPKFATIPCPHVKRIPQKCKKFYENYFLEWIPAKDLKVDDYLVYPRHYEINPQKIFNFEIVNRHKKEILHVMSIPLNFETMWLIGIGLANASIPRNSHYVRFYFSPKKKNQYKKVAEIIKKYFPYEKIKIIEYKPKRKYELRIHSAYLRAFLEETGGRTSSEKRIHPVILSQSPHLLIDLLWGLYEGNGSLIKTNQKTRYINFSTSSPVLAGQILLILIRLGYHPNLKIIKKGQQRISKYNEKIITRHNSYTIYIRDTNLTDLFLKKAVVNFYAGRRCLTTEDYVYFPIRKIVKQKFSGKVYDFETDGSFLTANGIVHNCARKVNFMNAVNLIFWATKHTTSRKYATFNYELGQHPDYVFSPIPAGKERYKHGFHPTQKPEKVIEWLIKYLTKEGDTILDPFMGSGTTLVVANRLNRNAIGIDISKEFCEMTYKRITQDVSQLKLNFDEDKKTDIVKINF